MGSPAHKSKVLIADDSETDIFFLTRAFRTSGLDLSLATVQDGQQAMDYLEQEQPCPDLVLLDLKMPKRDGFDVLKWIQTQPDLAKLTVAVVSSSDLDEDKRLAAALGAKAYFVKTPDFQKLAADVEAQFLKA